MRQVESSEQRLRTMFDAAADSVFVKDRSLKYTHVNHAMEQLHGASRHDFVGRTDEELFGTVAVSTVRDEDLLVLEGNTIDTESTKQVGKQMRTFHVVKVPMRDDAGQITGLFGIARDITDRRKAETDLHLAQFSLDRAADSVLWIQRDGAIVYANDAARENIDSPESTAHIWDVDLRFVPESWSRFWYETSDQTSTTYETEFSTRRGDAIDMEVRTYRFSHQLTDLLCMFARDISERKRLQAEVQQRLAELSHLSRMQIATEMVAGMAHELNQPLSAVANYSHIVASALSDNASVWTDESERKVLSEKAQVICDESLRAGEIIRRLRKLVNKREHKRGRMNLNQLVMETLRIYESQWAGAANPIVADLAPGQILSVVDEIQIQQVLLNLLSNAKDAVQQNPKNASIVVRTSRPDEDSAIISVQDNGRGFKDFGLEKLFQPFVSTKQSGMGLGLAISRSIARAHGGDLTAEEVPDAGAIFRLTLPLTKVE